MQFKAKALAITLIIGSVAAQPSTDALGQEGAMPADMAERLKEGGVVLYLRHERSAKARPQIAFDIDDCTTQRNLTQEGIAGSEEIGAIVERVGVPLGTVVSSPYCRSIDTARLAFGEPTIEPRLMGNFPEVGRTMEEAGSDLLAVIKEMDRDGEVSVLVAHSGNTLGAFGAKTDEGGIFVLDVTQDDEVEIIGRLQRNELMALIEGGEG